MQTERFTSYLKGRGLKLTQERLAVLQGVAASDGHFDADELALVVKGINAKVSRATVYRVIPLLVDAGFITKTIRTKGRVSYERLVGTKPHDHMICRACGVVIEFHESRLERYIRSTCADHDFVPEEHTLSIRGYCRDCAGK
jgi:Fur family ferric uptake transcriptional regulator